MKIKIDLSKDFVQILNRQIISILFFVKINIFIQNTEDEMHPLKIHKTFDGRKGSAKNDGGTPFRPLLRK